jgi:hypothetical protein
LELEAASTGRIYCWALRPEQAARRKEATTLRKEG